MPVDWILHNLTYAQGLAEMFQHHHREFFAGPLSGMLRHAPQFFQHNFRIM